MIKHSHSCAHCGTEFACQCPNPSDDAKDCGACPLDGEDLELYQREAQRG